MKDLYIYLQQREVHGCDYDEGDGSPYSGYHHYEKFIEKIGPARIIDHDWGYERVEEVDPEIFEKEPDHVTIVYVTYSSGGTFGRTSGQVSFEYATTSAAKAEKWLKKNKKRLENYYSGYFDRLNDIEIDIVHLH
jgi:hypothetical protein